MLEGSRIADVDVATRPVEPLWLSGSVPPNAQRPVTEEAQTEVHQRGAAVRVPRILPEGRWLHGLDHAELEEPLLGVHVAHALTVLAQLAVGHFAQLLSKELGQTIQCGGINCLECANESTQPVRQRGASRKAVAALPPLRRAGVPHDLHFLRFLFAESLSGTAAVFPIKTFLNSSGLRGKVGSLCSQYSVSLSKRAVETAKSAEALLPSEPLKMALPSPSRAGVKC